MLGTAALAAPGSCPMQRRRLDPQPCARATPGCSQHTAPALSWWPRHGCMPLLLCSKSWSHAITGRGINPRGCRRGWVRGCRSGHRHSGERQGAWCVAGLVILGASMPHMVLKLQGRRRLTSASNHSDLGGSACSGARPPSEGLPPSPAIDSTLLTPSAAASRMEEASQQQTSGAEAGPVEEWDVEDLLAQNQRLQKVTSLCCAAQLVLCPARTHRRTSTQAQENAALEAGMQAMIQTWQVIHTPASRGAGSAKRYRRLRLLARRRRRRWHGCCQSVLQPPNTGVSPRDKAQAAGSGRSAVPAGRVKRPAAGHRKPTGGLPSYNGAGADWHRVGSPCPAIPQALRDSSLPSSAAPQVMRTEMKRRREAFERSEATRQVGFLAQPHRRRSSRLPQPQLPQLPLLQLASRANAAAAAATAASGPWVALPLQEDTKRLQYQVQRLEDIVQVRRRAH